MFTFKVPHIPEIREKLPIAVVLVIDTSSSMLQEKKLDYAKAAGKILINKLKKND